MYRLDAPQAKPVRRATAPGSVHPHVGPRASSHARALANAHEMRVVGMSRSGNHAIIQWILEQAQGRLCFLNCAEPKTNPYLTARPIHEDDPWWSNVDDFDIFEERYGRFSRKDLLLHSYEDCFLGMVDHRDFEDEHDFYVGPSARRTDLLILRDPFNLFASRHRAGIFHGNCPDGRYTVPRTTAMRIWKQHARGFLGRGSAYRRHCLPVNYNRWATERAYRRELAATLGLPFTDAGFETVAPAAGGSSFDGATYDGSASSMRTLERWRAYADDEEYLAFFDEPMLAFSEEIFGPTPAIPKLAHESLAS